MFVPVIKLSGLLILQEYSTTCNKKSVYDFIEVAVSSDYLDSFQNKT